MMPKSMPILWWLDSLAIAGTAAFIGAYTVQTALHDLNVPRAPAVSAVVTDFVAPQAEGGAFWTNPVTKLQADIGPSWTFAPQPTAAGKAYRFTNAGAQTSVTLKEQNTANWGLFPYATDASFQLRDVTFPSVGQLLFINGRQAWQNRGWVINNPTRHVDVLTIQAGGKFWTETTISTGPAPAAPAHGFCPPVAAETCAVQREIWNTIR